MNKTTFIWLLPFHIQNRIESELRQIGLSKKEISVAMSSRLCDLEDTINIQKITEQSSINLKGY